MRLWYRASVIGNKIYRGVLTGFNQAFVIDSKTRARLLAANSANADLIRPLAVGDDVRKWHVRDKDRYLIVTRIGVDMQRYPEIFEHLKQWEDNLRRRSDQGNHWWELRSCDYYDAFDKPKIIYPDIAKEPRFVLDKNNTYVSNTTYFMPTEDYYLLGVLNSQPLWEYCKRAFTVIGDPDKGGRLRFFSQDVLQIPIPIATPEERQKVETLVLECLKADDKMKGIFEKKIDVIIAGLYGLDDSLKP